MVKPNNIRPVSQREKFINMIVYGVPGIGKTRLAGTSPNALILECGKGETDTNAAAGQKVDVWEIHTESDLEEAYQYCRHQGFKDYTWIWIDGVTPLEGRLMKSHLQRLHAERPNRSELIPDKSDYQIIQKTIDKYIGLFVDLPVNFGCTAHVMFETGTAFDEEGDEQQVLRMMPEIQGGRGKLAQKICSYMNIVGFLDVVSGDEGNVRAMLVQGDSQRAAKDRFHVLANEHGWLLNPAIPKIEAAVKRKLGDAPAKKATKVAAKKATKTTTKATGLRRK